jgi:hypothetical protein
LTEASLEQKLRQRWLTEYVQNEYQYVDHK